MNKNEKYFLNSLRKAPRPAALSLRKLRSGHITRDIREMARLAISPNFSFTSFQKNFAYTGTLYEIFGFFNT